MQGTTVFSKNLDAFVSGKRYVINQGGTRSSKTWAILQLLFFIARNRPNSLISVVSETMPHLKRGAIRDFEEILKGLNYPYEHGHNKSNHVYRIDQSQVEFFSADNPSRLRGAARDYLFINECNNLSLRSFDELEVRTRHTIFLDFNPVSEFWVHTELMPRLPSEKYAFIRSTYRDNDTLGREQIESIESRRHRDPSWWKVYGEGEIGHDDGLIFPSIELVDVVPEGGRRMYGMDFGYTNDPTVLVELTLHGTDLYIDQLLYRTGMTNADIIAFLRGEGVRSTREIVADSSEPKSIDEIHRAGFNVHPSRKGADSVRQGIDTLKQYDLKLTKRSTDAVKEFRNYKFKTDKDGKALNEPIDFWNHAIDACRYALTFMLDLPTSSPRSTFTRLRTA